MMQGPTVVLSIREWFQHTTYGTSIHSLALWCFDILLPRDTWFQSSSRPTRSKNWAYQIICIELPEYLSHLPYVLFGCCRFEKLRLWGCLIGTLTLGMLSVPDRFSRSRTNFPYGMVVLESRDIQNHNLENIGKDKHKHTNTFVLFYGLDSIKFI